MDILSELKMFITCWSILKNIKILIMYVIYNRILKYMRKKQIDNEERNR